MKTLAIISQKGGSGKTTIAVHMAVCAIRQGYHTAIIDIDPQGSAFDWYLSRETQNELNAVQAQAGQLEVAPFVRTVFSVFKVESLPGVRLPVRPSAAARHTLRPGSFSLILNGAGTCCTSPNTA